MKFLSMFTTLILLFGIAGLVQISEAAQSPKICAEGVQGCVCICPGGNKKSLENIIRTNFVLPGGSECARCNRPPPYYQQPIY